jgi:hypothetical protein
MGVCHRSGPSPWRATCSSHRARRSRTVGRRRCPPVWTDPGRPGPASTTAPASRPSARAAGRPPALARHRSTRIGLGRRPVVTRGHRGLYHSATAGSRVIGYGSSVMPIGQRRRHPRSPTGQAKRWQPRCLTRRAPTVTKAWSSQTPCCSNGGRSLQVGAQGAGFQPSGRIDAENCCAPRPTMRARTPAAPRSAQRTLDFSCGESSVPGLRGDVLGVRQGRGVSFGFHNTRVRCVGIST